MKERGGIFLWVEGGRVWGVASPPPNTRDPRPPGGSFLQQLPHCQDFPLILLSIPPGPSDSRKLQAETGRGVSPESGPIPAALHSSGLKPPILLQITGSGLNYPDN